MDILKSETSQVVAKQVAMVTVVTKASPPFLLNSSAFPPDLQAALGIAFSVMNHRRGSGIIPAKSSWKPSLLVSLIPTNTLSRAHWARGMPETRADNQRTTESVSKTTSIS